MALYVSSHYKNSPNDLQLMADAPAHHLFVLLGISPFFPFSFFFLFLVVSFTFPTWGSHPNWLFTGPVDESKNQLPDILCVIQVCNSYITKQINYHSYQFHCSVWGSLIQVHIFKKIGFTTKWVEKQEKWNRKKYGIKFHICMKLNYLYLVACFPCLVSCCNFAN